MEPLNNVRYKQRIVNEFLITEKETIVNTHRRLCYVYGSCEVDRSTVSRWVQTIKDAGSGDSDLLDKPRCGRPATATNAEILKRAERIILPNRRITSEQLTLHFL